MSGIQLTIFWAPPRAWVTSPAMPFVAHTLSSRLQMPVLHCCCCSWWSFHGTGISKITAVFHWNQTSSIASHKLSSWCQASTPLHNPLSPEPSIATEAAPSTMAFHGLSQCQASAALHDSFLPSKPVPPGWLLHITKSCCSRRYNFGYLWNTASLCFQKTLPRRCHLNEASLFLIITNFLAPANQHQ